MDATTLRRWRSRVLRWLLYGAAGAVAAIVLFTLAALNFAYSRGERVGYVQKLSKKGWICKTWEGELAMVNLPGTLPEIFRF